MSADKNICVIGGVLVWCNGFNDGEQRTSRNADNFEVIILLMAFVLYLSTQEAPSSDLWVQILRLDLES